MHLHHFQLKLNTISRIYSVQRGWRLPYPIYDILSKLAAKNGFKMGVKDLPDLEECFSFNEEELVGILAPPLLPPAPPDKEFVTSGTSDKWYLRVTVPKQMIFSPKSSFFF